MLLAIDKASPGSVLHAVAEEGVATRDIAQALGQFLALPVESIFAGAAPAHFGWLAMPRGGVSKPDVRLRKTRPIRAFA